MNPTKKKVKNEAWWKDSLKFTMKSCKIDPTIKVTKNPETLIPALAILLRVGWGKITPEIWCFQSKH